MPTGTLPYCVGLTGGIGCGKSKAADLFAARGATIVDTDEISHALTRSGGAAMPALERAFGSEFVTPDGSLDRARTRELVFNDAQARRRLESILHPLIRENVERAIGTASGPYAILVVPLLLETGAYRELVKRVLVVDCDERQQIARTMKRSQLTEDQVRRIMDAQLPRAERLRRADDVIGNDADISSLDARVAALHREYLAAAVADRSA